MVGGDREAVEPIEPAFRSLAPENGYLHAGPPGAGHYVKMVHNGIEYGLMQAYAEGFEIMHASEYPLDLGPIAELWNHGSVVRSWLLELAVDAFKRNGPDLPNLKGWVADSARSLDCPGGDRPRRARAGDHPVAADALPLAPGRSYGAKVLAALRNEFGGHAVKTE